MEYHKIETLFERNEKFIIDTSKLRHPVIATISEWDVTEKIDGTNIRVMLSEIGEVTFGGRTDRAQMPADLIQYLLKTFTPEKLKTAFEREGEPLPSVVLYGEGYGPGIQKGGCYRADKAFRLFDVLVDGKWWLDWSNTCDVASKLGIQTVPYLGRWTLLEITNAVKHGIASVVAKEESGKDAMAEGIVARPIETLFDKKGHRLIIKLKTRDFGGGKWSSFVSPKKDTNDEKFPQPHKWRGLLWREPMKRRMPRVNLMKALFIRALRCNLLASPAGTIVRVI